MPLVVVLCLPCILVGLLLLHPALFVIAAMGTLLWVSNA